MQIKKKLIQFCSFLFFLLFFSLFSGPVLATGNLWDQQAGLGDGSIGEAFGDGGEPRDVRLVIADIIYIVLGFVGIIFLVLVIISGYQWMTAGGNADQVDKAKTRLKNAVIGLVIVFLAFSITYFITNILVESINDPVF
jgi:hypothetical protein